MGFSIDFLGGKIYDAVSASPLSAAQVSLPTPLVLPPATARSRATSPTTPCSRSVRATRSERGSSSPVTSTSILPTRTIRWPPARSSMAGTSDQPQQRQFPERQDPADGLDRREVLDHVNPRRHRAYYHEWQNAFATGSAMPAVHGRILTVQRRAGCRFAGGRLALRPAHGHVCRRDVVASQRRLGEQLLRQQRSVRPPRRVVEQQVFQLRSGCWSPLPVLTEA